MAQSVRRGHRARPYFFRCRVRERREAQTRRPKFLTTMFFGDETYDWTRAFVAPTSCRRFCAPLGRTTNRRPLLRQDQPDSRATHYSPPFHIPTPLPFLFLDFRVNRAP